MVEMPGWVSKLGRGSLLELSPPRRGAPSRSRSSWGHPHVVRLQNGASELAPRDFKWGFPISR